MRAGSPARNRLFFTLALLTGSALAAGESAAQARVSWAPEQPMQGTLFTISVAAGDAPMQAVRGTFAEERLHFERQPDGTFRALAAAPIDAANTVPLALEVRRENGRTETLSPLIPIARGTYRLERLSVAPQFSRPPEPALAARMAAEAERAREVSRRSHDTPRLWDGEFVRPRDSRITSGFGHGRVFNGQVQSRHMGTDFAGAVGAPIRAPARGVVALVDAFYLGGNVIYIDHGAGLVTAYLHLSAQEVVEGDVVEAGQIIGRVGATGRVTGPHLHWIVRYGTITVDPMSFVELAEGQALSAPAAAR